MSDLTILHVAGDEALAGALAARLPAHRCRQLCVTQDAEVPPRSSLIAIWSARAFERYEAQILDDHCLPHPGLVMICCADNTPLPDLLEDPDYWLIDFSIDDATVFEAERGRAIVEAASAARQEAARAATVRRRRKPLAPTSRAQAAFLNSALAGLAGSVSLLGVLGATAISAAQQSEVAPPPDADQVEAAAGIPVWRAPQSTGREPWAEARPMTLQQINIAQIEATLATASARLDANRGEVDRRIGRLDALARSDWPTTEAAYAANTSTRLAAIEDGRSQSVASEVTPHTEAYSSVAAPGDWLAREEVTSVPADTPQAAASGEATFEEAAAFSGSTPAEGPPAFDDEAISFWFSNPDGSIAAKHSGGA